MVFRCISFALILVVQGSFLIAGEPVGEIIPVVPRKMTNASQEMADPIQTLKGLLPAKDALAPEGALSEARRLVVKVDSLNEAKIYFDKDALAKIEKTIDFKKSVLLVFVWKGSGRDKLSYTVLESFPEQIRFQLTPGRTRDLSQHFQVFAVRSDVTWKSEFTKKKSKPSKKD